MSAAVGMIDNDSPRRFGTILVGRPQTQRPSELEVMMREHCHKMRILSSPSKLSGAHMVFEKGVALRIYYPNELARLDNEEGTDGIFDFCMAFKWAVVFFVTPDPLHYGSFIDRAMTMAFMEDVPDDKTPPRLMVFSDTNQVMTAFFTFLENATSTERRRKRAKVIRTIQDSVNEQVCVASAMRGMLAPPRCPMGEADIVLRHFGSLQDIIKSSDDELDYLPIERRTKEITRTFFCGEIDDSRWRSNLDGADENTVLLNDLNGSFCAAQTMDAERSECSRSADWRNGPIAPGNGPFRQQRYH